MRNIKASIILIVVFLSAMSVNAEARKFNWRDIDIQVVSDYSGTKTEYEVNSARRNQRSYIAVKNGERYSIRVRNRSNERIGVVLAVDGRNIINGKKSWLKRNEPMYVLEPWETAEYEGWRTNRSRVNRFYFTDVDDSYADAWGDHSAMGVIAAAVYREKDTYPDHRYEYDRVPSRESSRSGMHPKSTGTGFGESEWSPARKVHFVARKKPAIKKFIKYEWKRTLCRMGIIDSCRNHDRDWDNRFWHDDEDDYAPYPWQIRNHRY